MRQLSETKRARLARYTRERLLSVDSVLRDTLSRETRVSVRSFIGQYLPALDFYCDAREALERGELSLLKAHLLAQRSETILPQRVKEALGELREPDSTETKMLAVEKADEVLETDPLDASHLFFEELRMIPRALREIGPEEATDEDPSGLCPL